MDSNKFKILQIAPCVDSYFGGSAAVVRAYTEGILKLDNNVTILSTTDSKIAKDDQREFFKNKYGNFQLKQLQRCWPKCWFNAKDLIRNIEHHIPSADIVHLHLLWDRPVLIGAKVAQHMKKPYLVSPHGCLEPWRLRHKFIKKALYLRFFTRSIMQKAKCLHAVTEMEFESFRKIGYNGDITIVPIGIEARQFQNLPTPAEAEDRWPILKNHRVVLFLSRLSPEKGLDILISAWAQLMRQQKYRDTILIIAGPDNRGYELKVKEIIKSYSLSKHVLLFGMVQGRPKHELFCRADIFILPSYSENFGLVVPEALACQCPVITTTGTPWKKLNEENAGRWVPPTQESIYEALCELLDMPENQRKEMGQRGRKLVLENYTWDIATQKLLTVYKCIFDGKDIPLHPEPLKTANYTTTCSVKTTS